VITTLEPHSPPRVRFGERGHRIRCLVSRCFTGGCVVTGCVAASCETCNGDEWGVDADFARRVASTAAVARSCRCIWINGEVRRSEESVAGGTQGGAVGGAVGGGRAVGGGAAAVAGLCWG